jgi:hypothetical protein
MRILFVAFSNSIHTTRWINQLDGQGWDIHLFPSIDIGAVNPELRNVTVHHSFYPVQKNRHYTIKSRGIPVVFPRIAREISTVGRYALKDVWPGYRLFQLQRLIRKLKPDIIHSMEIQAAGYLVSDVRKKYHGQFPNWIVTNYGNDIYLFGNLKAHVNKIKGVLANCEYYFCECQRDVLLAQKMGFRGKVLPVLPNVGGFDLAQLAQFRQPGPTSARRLIVLKGYQDWHGRALFGLRAIALCTDILKDYQIAIYSANEDVMIAAELLSKSSGIPIEVIPRCSHDDIMRLHGRARIYIGLAISDGISISSIEAIAMGAFPIQSSTSCCNEWIVDGETGIIVPPEDPEVIAAAIRKAVSDDRIVDRAAELNARVAQKRLDQAVIKPQVIAMYKKIATEVDNKRKRS